MILLVFKKMEQKKCSSNKHKEINAISFCQECNIYMCNKCDNYHKENFENHNKYEIGKDNVKKKITEMN